MRGSFCHENNRALWNGLLMQKKYISEIFWLSANERKTTVGKICSKSLDFAKSTGENFHCAVFAEYQVDHKKMHFFFLLLLVFCHCQTKISTVSLLSGREWAGDNGPANASILTSPYGMALDKTRNLMYLCDSEMHRIRIVNMTANVIFTFCGTGVERTAVDGAVCGTAAATLLRPVDIVFDEWQNVLFFSEQDSHRV